MNNIISSKEKALKGVKQKRNLTMFLLFLAIPGLSIFYYLWETTSGADPIFFTSPGQEVGAGIVLCVLMVMAVSPIIAITLSLFEKRINNIQKEIRELRAEENMYALGVGDYYHVSKFSEEYIRNPKRGLPNTKVYLWLKNGELHFTQSFLTMRNYTRIRLEDIVNIDMYDNSFVEETVSRYYTNDPLFMGIALLTGLDKKVRTKEYGTPFVAFIARNGDYHYFEPGVYNIIVNEINAGNVFTSTI